MAQNLAAILGIDMVLSGGGIYNSGNEADANPTVGDIWSDDYAMLARVAVTDDLEAPALARTPIWTAMGAGTDGEYAVYEEPQTKSRVVQGDMYSDEIIIDARLGLLLKID